MKTKLQLLMFIAIGAMASCEKEITSIPADIIFAEGAVTTPTLTSAEGTATVTFSSTQAWTAEVEADKTWCTVSPTSGDAGAEITLTITTIKNETYDNRTAKIELISDSVKKEVTATQTQTDSFRLEGKPTETFDLNGGSFNITTTANTGEPKVGEIPDWITFVKNPTSRGLSETIFTFTVLKTVNDSERSAEITITSGSKSDKFTVKQHNMSMPIIFADYIFKKYLVERTGTDPDSPQKMKIDMNGDGEISYSEASEVIDISCTYLEISSLSGIEHFTALTDLACYSNMITTLDLSKNTKVTVLDCSDNMLTTLDVSLNTKMIELICSNTSLTSLDVSLNTNLTYLECSENKLTTLNLSKNTALTNLYCDNSELTTLDISKNIALKYFSCAVNMLTTLDVSKSPALKYFYCGDNKLTTLDVSLNTALTDLYCHINKLTTLDVSKNTALIDLKCYMNELTTLGISKNPALKHLHCSENKLTTLDVSKNSALRFLYCDPMNDVDGNNLLKSISKKTGQDISIEKPAETTIRVI